ncbi:hypothetical protein [Pseudomonas sp. GL-B-19]|nr:hypothetical protein [Pseudomonas sp. GL-B-19]
MKNSSAIQLRKNAMEFPGAVDDRRRSVGSKRHSIDAACRFFKQPL